MSDETKTTDNPTTDQPKVSNAMFVPANLDTAQYERVTLPTFLRPEDFPIGAMLAAKVVRIIGNFTNDPDMDDCQNLWLKNDAGEVLFPVTGVIGQALIKLGDIVGRELVFIRLPDGKDGNFKNRMFMFDVAVKRDASNPTGSVLDKLAQPALKLREPKK